MFVNGVFQVVDVRDDSTRRMIFQQVVDPEDNDRVDRLLLPPVHVLDHLVTVVNCCPDNRLDIKMAGGVGPSRSPVEPVEGGAGNQQVPSRRLVSAVLPATRDAVERCFPGNYRGSPVVLGADVNMSDGGAWGRADLAHRVAVIGCEVGPSRHSGRCRYVTTTATLSSSCHAGHPDLVQRLASIISRPFRPLLLELKTKLVMRPLSLRQLIIYFASRVPTRQINNSDNE